MAKFKYKKLSSSNLIPWRLVSFVQNISINGLNSKESKTTIYSAVIKYKIPEMKNAKNILFVAATAMTSMCSFFLLAQMHIFV